MAADVHQALDRVESAARDASFGMTEVELVGLPVSIGRRADFRLRWFATRLHTFVVIAAFESPPSDMLLEFDALSQDGRFAASPHHGDSGWLALSLDDPDAVDWNEVGELLESAYRHVAPHSLLGD